MKVGVKAPRAGPAKRPGKSARARVARLAVKGMPMAEQLPEMPAWFDEGRHVNTDRGLYERGTGLSLAEDGLPVAGMIRAQRLAQNGAKTDPLGLVSEDLIAAEARAQKVVAESAVPTGLDVGTTDDATAFKSAVAGSGRKLKAEVRDAE